MSFPQGQVRGDPLTLTEEIQMGCHFSAHSLPSSPMTLHNQPTMEEGHCLLLSSQLVSPFVSFLYKFRKRVSFTLYFCNLIIWVFKVMFFFFFFFFFGLVLTNYYVWLKNFGSTPLSMKFFYFSFWWTICLETQL